MPRQNSAGRWSLAKRAALPAGLALAAAAAIDLLDPATPRLSLALCALAAAGLLLAYALGRPGGPVTDSTAGMIGPPGLARRPPAWLGPLLLAVGTAAGLVAAGRYWLAPAAWQEVCCWWCAALAGLVGGAVTLDLQAGRLVPPRAWRPDPLVGLAVAALAGLALLLRVIWLDEIPPGIFTDETNSAVEAIAIVRGGQTSPFGTGWYATPAGYIYLQALFIKLLGPTLAALKAPGILAGVLTLLGTFAVGRSFFGIGAGLIAATFMTFAHWPLLMSRWGWNATWPPVVHAWAVFCLFTGARSRRVTDFALAGLLLGLGMYTYLSIRVVLLALAVTLAYQAVLARSYLRQHLGRLVLLSLVWAMAFAPLAVTYIKEPDLFFGRLNEVSIFNDVARAGSLAPLIDQVRGHLLMFHVAGDANARHNLPGAPMLEPVMGALFALAVTRAVVLARDARYGILVLWLLLGLLGGILSNDGVQAYRTLTAASAVALLCGELLARLGQRLRDLTSRLPAVAAGRWLPGAGVAAVLVWSGWLNLQIAFVRFPSHPDVYRAFAYFENAAAREIATHAATRDYYLAPQFYGSSIIRYVAEPLILAEPGPDPPLPYRLFRGLDDLPLMADGRRDAVVLLTPDWTGLAGALRLLYPNLRVEAVPARHAGIVYERLTIPARDLVEARGLVAERQWPDGRRERLRVADPAVGLPGDYSQVEYTASLFVPSSGERRIWVAGGAPLTIDDRPMTGPRFLARGLHPLRLTLSGDQARAGVQLLWTEPGRAEPQPVPPAYFFTRDGSPAAGLTGSYYPNERWEGTPFMRRIDPGICFFGWSDHEPWPGPLSISWQGEIDIPATGPYTFSVESDDGARLFIDGQLVGESLAPSAGNAFEARLTLARGRHAIRLDYFNRDGAKAVQLRWSHGEGPLGLVPAEALRPAP